MSAFDSTASPYIVLRGGLTVRAAALEVLLEFERRGVRLSRDGDSVLLHTPAVQVSDEDRADIRRHKAHLLTLLDYCDQGVSVRA